MYPLQDGHYIIISLGGRGGYVSRHFAEPRCGGPKSILSRKHLFELNNIHWVIRRTRNGGYKLFNMGNPTVYIGDRLFATLDNENEAESWQIESFQQQGEGLYVIRAADGCRGWVTQDYDEAQVVVRPLVTTFSMPPMSPVNQLFLIKPANEMFQWSGPDSPMPTHSSWSHSPAPTHSSWSHSPIPTHSSWSDSPISTHSSWSDSPMSTHSSWLDSPISSHSPAWST